MPRKSKSNIYVQMKGVILNPQGLPLFLTFTLIIFLFVIFRMKTVELDYRMSATNKDVKAKTVDNKSLKAKKARLLSIKRLRKLAGRYSLSEPRQRQIIVIE